MSRKMIGSRSIYRVLIPTSSLFRRICSSKNCVKYEGAARSQGTSKRHGKESEPSEMIDAPESWNNSEPI